MYKYLTQSDTSKLSEKDFDNVINFIEEFSESVMFQNDEKRKTKFCNLFQKISKHIEVQKAQKSVDFMKEEPKSKKEIIMKFQKPNLPDEIWIKILNFLSCKDIFLNLALVSKHFYNLTLDSRAVKTIHLKEIKTAEKYENAMEVLKRSKNLYEVYILNSLKYCNNFIVQTFKSSPNLKSLAISRQSNNWFKLSKTAIESFGKNLELLKLEGVYIEEAGEMMTKVFSQKNLKDLHVCLRYENVVKTFLEKLPENCKNLQNIYFDRTTLDDFHVPVVPISAHFKTFFEKMKGNLESIRLNKLYCQNSFNKPMMGQILVNVGVCEKLQHLEVRDASLFTNEFLNAISELPNLRDLDLRKLGPKLSKINTLFLQMDLKNMEKIHLQGSPVVTDELLKAIALRMPPKLYNLSITGSKNLEVQKSTLKSLMDCPSLKIVGFEWSNLNGVSNSFLREFNEEICLYLLVNDEWVKLNKYIK